jgi:DNA-binding beta-propeller fold protein YncE
VSELSEKTGAAVGGFSPGFGTGALVADPADDMVYAGSIDDNGGSGAVITGVSEATGKVTGTIPIPFGSDPWPIAVDPGAGRLFALGGGGELSVISLKAGAVTATVPAGSGADGIAVDPCSGDVYVADGIKGTVTVYRHG